MKQIWKSFLITINVLIGRHYMFNVNSGVIHDLRLIGVMCDVDDITRYEFMSETEAVECILFEDGRACKWCGKKLLNIVTEERNRLCRQK